MSQGVSMEPFSGVQIANELDWDKPYHSPWGPELKKLHTRCGCPMRLLEKPDGYILTCLHCVKDDFINGAMKNIMKTW
jgi:hypothetical protein